MGTRSKEVIIIKSLVQLKKKKGSGDSQQNSIFTSALLPSDLRNFTYPFLRLSFLICKMKGHSNSKILDQFLIEYHPLADLKPVCINVPLKIIK